VDLENRFTPKSMLQSSSSLSTLKYKDIFLVPTIAAWIKESPVKSSAPRKVDPSIASTGSSVQAKHRRKKSDSGKSSQCINSPTSYPMSQASQTLAMFNSLIANKNRKKLWQNKSSDYINKSKEDQI